jgi:DNA modification methylase
MTHKLSRLVDIKSVLIEDRLRVDMGEVEDLAESIQVNGIFHPPVVESLRGSEHPEFRYRLLAGGRRMAALTLLNSNKVEGFEQIPVTVFDELEPDQRVVVELEENLQRKEMTWQETLAGIVKYHKAKKRLALEEGDNWTQGMTGKLLNMNQAKVSIAFKVHRELLVGNERVAAAANLNDAIKLLLGEELDQAQAEQMRRIQLKRAEQAAQSSNGQKDIRLPTLSSSVLVSAQASQSPSAPNERVQFTPTEVAAFYHHGNALEVLPLLASHTLINHIICDPPYGIDMDMLTRKDMGRFEAIERITETHDVEDNLKMLPEFLSVAFKSIAEDGFLCMWYDLDHHEKIKMWAEKIGWRVQRWPFVWCKTSSCLNNAAQCNVTKATEVCYFMRRSEKSIIKTKQSKNYILAPSAATSTHPFPKPHEIWKYCIDSVSVEGQNIVDPFAGEGSSLASIFKTGRIPIGIEIDERHIASGLSYVCEQINQRSLLDDVLSPPL